MRRNRYRRYHYLQFQQCHRPKQRAGLYRWQRNTFQRLPKTGAVYHWTGPNGFTSSQQNPVINNITAADTGVYTIVDSRGSCATGAGTTDVGVSGTATPPTVTASKLKSAPAILRRYAHQPAIPIMSGMIWWIHRGVFM